MRKILCVMTILVVLTLCVPAASLAKRTESFTGLPIGVPTDPSVVLPPAQGAIPDSAMIILGEVADHMSMAYATHDYSGIDDYLANVELRLAQAIGATDKNDVKAWAHVDQDEQTLQAKVMIRPDILDKKLEADMHVQKNDAGLYQVDIKIKGDVTAQQKAYAQVLIQKIKYQVPGIVINVKYL